MLECIYALQLGYARTLALLHVRVWIVITVFDCLFQDLLSKFAWAHCLTAWSTIHWGAKSCNSVCSEHLALHWKLDVMNRGKWKTHAGHLWLEPPVLCHWATTEWQPPPLYVLHRWYWMPQSHTWQPLMQYVPSEFHERLTGKFSPSGENPCWVFFFFSHSKINGWSILLHAGKKCLTLLYFRLIHHHDSHAKK